MVKFIQSSDVPGLIKDGDTVKVSVRAGALTLNGERIEAGAAAKPNLRLLN